MANDVVKRIQFKNRCPFIKDPPSNNCYCVKLDSQSTEAVLYYCDKYFSECEIFKIAVLGR